MSLKVAFSAGEPSGDEHLARVLDALGKTTSYEARGMGGRSVRELGCQTVVDCERHGSLMGFVEVALAARSVYQTFTTMTALLTSWKPDILVLVDYADFNLRLAKRAHALGIKVLYYITPQVWAWRRSRIQLFSRYIDRAAVIFPFEPAIFSEGGYDRAIFVGHPFSDTLAKHIDPDDSMRDSFFNEFSLDGTRKLLTIFPGSRSSEISRLLPVAIETARRLERRHPEVQICLGVAPAVAHKVRESLSSSKVTLSAIEGRSLDLLRYGDAALLKSGTSNLQAAFLDMPFSMFFKSSALSEFVVTHFVKIKEFSIVNVIRPGTVRELLQDFATPEALANEATELLFDETRRSCLLRGFAEVRSALGSPDPLELFSGCQTSAERTARLIIDTAQK